MSNTTLVDRFNEITAIAACRSSLDRLEEMAREPSGKRFARSRHDACLYWEQIEVTAATRKQAIQQAPVKRAVKPRKPAAPDNGVGVMDVAVELARRKKGQLDPLGKSVDAPPTTGTAAA